MACAALPAPQIAWTMSAARARSWSGVANASASLREAWQPRHAVAITLR